MRRLMVATAIAAITTTGASAGVTHQKRHHLRNTQPMVGTAHRSSDSVERIGSGAGFAESSGGTSLPGVPSDLENK